MAIVLERRHGDERDRIHQRLLRQHHLDPQGLVIIHPAALEASAAGRVRHACLRQCFQLRLDGCHALAHLFKLCP